MQKQDIFYLCGNATVYRTKNFQKLPNQVTLAKNEI